MEPYLIRLGNRLAAGLAEMDSQRRERHRQYILSQQGPDGGFHGRDGDSDVYYTSFAVRSLALLGGLTAENCDPIGSYLKSRSGVRDSQEAQGSVVDLVSGLNAGLLIQLAGGSDPFAEFPGSQALSGNRGAFPGRAWERETWANQMAETLESLRREDGGYAKSSEGAAGSTYHSFLVALAYELLGRSLPNPIALVQFLYDRQREDGGFVEIAPMKRSGTNPTAAAVALLTMLGFLDRELCEDVCGFLAEVYSPEGGFRANTRIPFADGLSTFTALLTAQDLGCEGLVDRSQLEAFVSGELELPTGGFRGAVWDEQADVEYTFYGLGILGLLASAELS